MVISADPGPLVRGTEHPAPFARRCASMRPRPAPRHKPRGAKSSPQPGRTILQPGRHLAAPKSGQNRIKGRVASAWGMRGNSVVARVKGGWARRKCGAPEKRRAGKAACARAARAVGGLRGARDHMLGLGGGGRRTGDALRRLDVAQSTCQQEQGCVD